MLMPSDTCSRGGGCHPRGVSHLGIGESVTHSNAIWRQIILRFDILLLDEEGKPARPWLTVIEDDYSRAIAGYRLVSKMQLH